MVVYKDSRGSVCLLFFDLLDACYFTLQDVDVGHGYESQGLGISSGDMYGRGRK